jgi:hypothetical protein
VNREVGLRWVAWLRDPSHKQGRGQLRDAEDRYCCLGGACEVLAGHSGKGEWINDEDRDGLSFKWPILIGDDGVVETAYAFPPSGVTEALGWRDFNPHFKVKADREEDGKHFNSGAYVHVYDDEGDMIPGVAVVQASVLNDSLEWSFKQIAAIVEAQLVNANGDGSMESASSMQPFDVSSVKE